MKESTKNALGGTFVMCFIIGIILFLLETRHTGEALERFNLVVLWSTISIVGIVIGAAALAALAVLYFPELKKTFKHEID